MIFTFEEILKGRVYRILRHLDNFIYFSLLPDQVPEYIKNNPQFQEEEVIGVYENIPRSPDKSLIISKSGIYFL